ncbi:MAG TPA: triose-phosphate isomerase [Longimicrobiales bacterium]|nr:triose-phosphate isomerase [Longimicrobiales bacterium]
MADIAPVLAGNWKMHMGPAEAHAFLAEFAARSPAASNRRVWFFPPAVSIAAALDATTERTDLLIGIQNIHWEPKGAFTGEISAPMAAAAGARLALVGHSERRHVFGETDHEVGLKVRAAVDAGLDVVACIGETLDQRRDGALQSVLSAQVEAALAHVLPGEARPLALAYEPVWAIGTGVNATPADAAEAHAWVRTCVAKRLGDTVARSIPILYGGSVKPDNARELLTAPDVNGLLVGGASLDPDSFARIVEAAG